MNETSAIERAKHLGVNLLRSRDTMLADEVMVTHYGWPSDPDGDSLTRKKIGNHDNTLNENSLALSRDLSEGFAHGDPVYINGFFLGTWDDTAPWPRTIDVYDPQKVMPTNWGGTLSNPEVTNRLRA